MVCDSIVDDFYRKNELYQLRKTFHRRSKSISKVLYFRRFLAKIIKAIDFALRYSVDLPSISQRYQSQAEEYQHQERIFGYKTNEAVPYVILQGDHGDAVMLILL